jgi:DNA-binding MarR family transcriptional regulator
MNFKPQDSKNARRSDQTRDQIMELVTRFGIASQLYTGAIERRLAPHGLTFAQLSVLSHMARVGKGGAEALRVTQIAQAVEVNQPAVTKMLTKFEGAGWVAFQSSANDRRARAASITPAGLAHLAQVRQSLFPELGQFLATWAPEERERLIQDLQRLGSFLESQRGLDARR